MPYVMQHLYVKLILHVFCWQKDIQLIKYLTFHGKKVFAITQSYVYAEIKENNTNKH